MKCSKGVHGVERDEDRVPLDDLSERKERKRGGRCNKEEVRGGFREGEGERKKKARSERERCLEGGCGRRRLLWIASFFFFFYK